MVEELPRRDRFGEFDDHLRETYRLLRIDDPEELRRIDSYRTHWESTHGKDPNGPFTCELPKHEREKMIREDPGAYYAGLPMFARVFYQAKCQSKAFNGNLDDLSDILVKAFVSRKGRIR